MAYYPPMPFQNPFRAVGGVTVAGGANTGVMSAVQHPDATAKADFIAKNNELMGRSPMRHPLASTGGFQASNDGYPQPTIHGYAGGGIPTNLFSQLTGRGPTASDVEQANGGGLSAPHSSMGSLQQFDMMQRMPSQWDMLQMSGGNPMLGHNYMSHGRPSEVGPASDWSGSAGSDWAPKGPQFWTDHPPSLPEAFSGSKQGVPPSSSYLPTLNLLNGQISQYLKRFI